MTNVTRITRFTGSGLGLAIARQLCDAHSWSIQLLPREGGGTEARLILPLNIAGSESE
ncbi:MAG: ATP-binding protein [Gammaproteobacteria bacterium]